MIVRCKHRKNPPGDGGITDGCGWQGSGDELTMCPRCGSTLLKRVDFTPISPLSHEHAARALHGDGPETDVDWTWYTREVLLDEVDDDPEQLTRLEERLEYERWRANENGRYAAYHFDRRIEAEKRLADSNAVALSLVATEAAAMLSETRHGGLTHARSESLGAALKAAGVAIPANCRQCPHGRDGD